MEQTNSTAKLLKRQGLAASDRLLGVRDVANQLGVCTRQIWKLAKLGRLPAPVRLGRSVRWRESDISEFIRLGCKMHGLYAERAV
jgi:excisionase family DNA binding protein